MALMNSLSSGISGLNGFQTEMDVIGNNIANVNTSGFKQSRVTFAEMIANNMARNGATADSAPQLVNQVGLGTQVSSIQRDFSQGQLNSTNIKTDLALQGNGFFLVNNNGNTMLTRAGNFQFNRNGELVTNNGDPVLGFKADSKGNIIENGSASGIKVDFNSVYEPKQTQNIQLSGNLNANTSTTQLLTQNSAFTKTDGTFATSSTALNNLKQTSTALQPGDTITITGQKNDGTAINATYTYAAGDTIQNLLDSINTAYSGEATATLVDGNINLTSQKPGDSKLSLQLAMGAGDTGNISLPVFKTQTAGTTNSNNVSATVYDSEGNAHTLLLKMTQTDFNTWQYKASFLDGEKITSGDTGTVKFDQNGNLTSGNSFNITYNPGNGATSTKTIAVNLGSSTDGSAVTQFNGNSTLSVTSNDGYGKGDLQDYSIDGDGNIVGTYNNGKTRNLAQIAVGEVNNPSGLVNKGNGLYALTAQTGQLKEQSAANLSNTTINSQFLEGSNVDLAKEFTDMIVAQRAYQSSARVITVSDQLLNEVVQLKR